MLSPTPCVSVPWCSFYGFFSWLLFFPAFGLLWSCYFCNFFFFVLCNSINPHMDCHLFPACAVTKYQFIQGASRIPAGAHMMGIALEKV